MSWAVGFVSVLENCPGGDLEKSIVQRGNVTEKVAKTITRQMLLGLKCLHGLGIIHYDVKPANILFTETGVVKLADFGLAKQAPNEGANIELTSPGCGTFVYLPPECAHVGRGNREGAPPQSISVKVDIWSAGIVLFQILFGSRPQFRVFNTTFIKFDFPTNVKVSTEVKTLITRMLAADPNERPSTSEVLESEWLSLKKGSGGMKSMSQKIETSSTLTQMGQR
ncbi:hypothetical protein KIPB_008772 [Kipferlia bialata]|uniref:Protein kinase domain-containing protein n=1 Tax=Kipferlia bialata TaxID=797122 RepID=A0A9K3D3B7_9EUKA|nr:hypothetical protein KIPB_008772 [Kipferlia bialata]|eukprot:g8772.t1